MPPKDIHTQHLTIAPDLIMQHREKLGRDNDLFKKQFEENPEMAIDGQKQQSKAISDLLEGRVPTSHSSKRDNKDYWITRSTNAYSDSSAKTEAPRSIEKNKEQEAQLEKGPSLER